MKARQKDRLEAELIPSCDKYGHSFGDDSERFPRRWPQSQTNAPLADRFGHICRSAELDSTGDEEAGENGTGNRLWKADELLTNRALEQRMSRICQSECS